MIKNIFLLITITVFSFILSGCDAVKLVKEVALLPVAVVDGFLGTEYKTNIDKELPLSLQNKKTKFKNIQKNKKWA